MTTSASIDLPLAAEDDCDACNGRMREGLMSHTGILDVDPLGRATVRVSYDPELCSVECLERAVAELRLDLDGTYAHQVCRIDGMDCADCAQTIERAVGRIDGVSSVTVSFPAASMRVEYETSVVELSRIENQVAKLGYRIDGADTSGRGVRLATILTRERATLVATLLLLLGLILDFATSFTAIPAYTAATVIGGLPLARSGIAALAATRRPDINLLMSIAVVGAFAIGAWLEAALVVVLFGVGELLEGRAVGRARRELASLVSLTPVTARVRRREGTGLLAVIRETEIDAANVRIGELVVVRPGERIPVDGVVREGASAVDQAPITGESTPVDKTAGDPVFAGSLNTQGLLVIEATVAPGDTTLARIAVLVTEAQAGKSASERWVDAFARWYTPAVVAVAVLVAGVPPAFGVDFSQSFYSALALLILACPCALVISTPVSIVSALGRASAAGVLVKGGVHLEQAATIRTVAFDKTGTLTEGRPRVMEIVALVGDDEGVLAAAASLENGSEHPLARAIVDEAKRREIATDAVTDFEALTGLGAQGRVGERSVTVGSPRLFPELPVEVLRLVEEQQARARTAVVVVVDGVPAGVIGIADALRPEAAEAVADLRRLGIESLVLLTGDNQATATVVAASAGIRDVRAELLPGDKAAQVATLASPVAMVGDGVNDAPALAAAQIGLAMGTAGSDTAIEVADVAIMGDDPRKVAGLIGLARWTRSIVRQNIAFSLGTKVIAAVVLAAGALPLWGAVLTDVGASLVVVANGLRLVRSRPTGPMRSLPMLTATPTLRRTIGQDL